MNTLQEACASLDSQGFTCQYTILLLALIWLFALSVPLLLRRRWFGGHLKPLRASCVSIVVSIASYLLLGTVPGAFIVLLLSYLILSTDTRQKLSTKGGEQPDEPTRLQASFGCVLMFLLFSILSVLSQAVLWTSNSNG